MKLHLCGFEDKKLIDATVGATVVVPKSTCICFCSNPYGDVRYDTCDGFTMERHPLLNHRKNEYCQNFRNKNQETFSRVHLTTIWLSIIQTHFRRRAVIRSIMFSTEAP